MEIRDFAVHRSFSGNGLWQWYEKPGSSAQAIETLTYTASATRKLESIGQEWDYFATENRNSNYTKTIVSTAAFDPNDPEAVDPDPIITGDDRVVVTGTQWFLNVRKMALGPRPEDVYRKYIESVFNLATGQRKGRSNTPDYTAGLGGMAPGGDPTPRDEWITTYEANWDPRNFYEADLDGIPLPEDRYLHLDAHLYKLPEGYVAPTSNTDGRTWTEYVIGAIAGQKGDAFDQQCTFLYGFYDNLNWLNKPLRQHILSTLSAPDITDYEGNVYFAGGVSTILVPVPPIFKGSKSLTATQ